MEKKQRIVLWPHGWKTEVAALLGVHRNTVYNALRAGTGKTYRRVMACAKNKYGA